MECVISSLLTLDALSNTDLRLWIEIYTDPEVMSRVGLALSKEKAIKLFDKVTAEDQNNLFFVIRNTQNNQSVGVIGLMRKQSEKSCYELGVMIHKKYNNKGYAYKATKLLLKLAFNQINVGAVITRCNVHNESANRISKALGFIIKSVTDEAQSGNKYNCWEMKVNQFNATVW